MEHLRDLVSLLTDIRLNGSLGTYKTEDRDTGSRSTLPTPQIDDVEPIARVTDCDVEQWVRDETHLEFPSCDRRLQSQ